MFIAEQQMVAAATGLAVRGYKPFASTFAAFFTRAFDFIRMGAISGVDVRLIGSHAGVEIGPDGPSQMALEDLAMMRAVHGSTVLYRPPTGRANRPTGESMRDWTIGPSGPAPSHGRTGRGHLPLLMANGRSRSIRG